MAWPSTPRRLFSESRPAVTDTPAEPVQPEPAAHANPDVPGATPERPISPAARRALAEAAERRAKASAVEAAPVEHGGPRGAEPTRYGDWEKKGLAVDF
jgi:hypothetical protein